MSPVRFIRLLCCFAGLTVSGIVLAVDVGDDDDLYNEGFNPGYVGEDKPELKEDTVHFPSWPSASDLIEVDLALPGFPYTLLVDEKSLSVGADRVVRYTAILRSAAGVDNVSYEGISCNRGEVRRYAYGSRGQFRPVRTTEWRYVRKQGQDRYRDALIENYFCPLPGGDRDEMKARIVAGLKAGNSPYR
ncbi:MAG: CNP1-like family protein [Thiogranum sp.]